MAPVATSPKPASATPFAHQPEDKIKSLKAKVAANNNNNDDASYAKPDGNKLDAVSDAVDAMNEYLGKHRDAPVPHDHDDEWRTAKSKFDEEKDKEAFRNYEDAADHVKALYREQHEKQTVAFNVAAREKYLGKCHARMTIWDAIEKLDTLVDESDPDTELSQIQHLLQTAEAMRRDGRPDWMQLTGLLHDLGKLMCFFGAEGQWDVVGDTFVVGAKFSEKCVYPDTFDANPDAHDPRYNTELGMYERNCGLDNIMLSWGHDEYMYWRLKSQTTIPEAGLDMIRFHSCYPMHRDGEYRQFFAPGDEDKMGNVIAFNAYDLYSKSDEAPDPVKLRPYYEAIIDKYVPNGGRNAVLEW